MYSQLGIQVFTIRHSGIHKALMYSHNIQLTVSQNKVSDACIVINLVNNNQYPLKIWKNTKLAMLGNDSPHKIRNEGFHLSSLPLHDPLTKQELINNFDRSHLSALEWEQIEALISESRDIFTNVNGRISRF